MAVNAGYKGAVWYGTSYKIASGTWSYSGETRNMQDIDEFSNENVEQLPLQIAGGDITISGHYLLDQDQGQKQLKIDFDAGTKIENLRLYTKYDTVYMLPSATGLNGGQSHVIVTSVNNVGDEKSGLGTLTATLHVNGTLEQIGSTTAMDVVTLGEIDSDGGTAAADDALFTAWGRLSNRDQDVVQDILCYFEWGTTKSFGDDSGASPTTYTHAEDPNVGEFDFEVTALVEDTLYYYRAVVEDHLGNKRYGETLSVQLPDGV